MAQQTINVGTSPNDGTGTPLRTAFQYTNSNFSELYTAVGPSGNNIVCPGSATITGDLTVDTSTLKVDSANDRVGVGTTSPGAKLTVAGAAEAVRVCNAAPYISFYNAAQSTRFGYVQHNGTNIGIVNEQAGSLELYTNNTLQATLNSTGLGVGASPTAKLHVQNSSLSGTTAGSNVIATLRSNGSGYDSFLQFSDNVAYNAGLGMVSGNLYFYTSGAERGRFNASGNLLVGRTGAGLDNTSGVTIGQASIGMQSEGNATQIVVNRTTSDGTIVDLRRNNSSVGNISVTTSGATFNSTSDYRLKESVAPLSGGLARVNALKPSVYKWKSNGSDGEGFLAHELAEVVPAAVNGEKDAVNEDGTIKAQSIDMSRIVPILVAAIKELTAEVNALKNA